MYQRTVEVNLSLLHYMADRGELMLVFLPDDGGVWVGDQTELEDLQLFIKEANQKEINRWEQSQPQVEATKAAGRKPLVFQDEDVDIAALEAMMKPKEAN